MRTLLVFVLSAIGGWFAASAIQSANRPELPPVEYQNGFSFEVPCDEHGSHVQIVTGNRLVRLYEISVDGIPQAEVTTEQIAYVLEMLQFMNDVKPLPNDQEESR